MKLAHYLLVYSLVFAFAVAVVVLIAAKFDPEAHPEAIYYKQRAKALLLMQEAKTRTLTAEEFLSLTASDREYLIYITKSAEPAATGS